MTTYQGRCHCGAVKFSFTSEPITSGIRCNCSICRRRGAVMSELYYTPETFRLEPGDQLGVYQWGDRDVDHYFCKTCGIFPFAGLTAKPGHYRVNLGCVDDIDPFALPIRLIDGQSY